MENAENCGPGEWDRVREQLWKNGKMVWIVTTAMWTRMVTIMGTRMATMIMGTRMIKTIMWTRRIMMITVVGVSSKMW